jgi:hypothetical protein
VPESCAFVSYYEGCFCADLSGLFVSIPRCPLLQLAICGLTCAARTSFVIKYGSENKKQEKTYINDDLRPSRSGPSASFPGISVPTGNRYSSLEITPFNQTF